MTVAPTLLREKELIEHSRGHFWERRVLLFQCVKYMLTIVTELQLTAKKAVLLFFWQIFRQFLG